MLDGIMSNVRYFMQVLDDIVPSSACSCLVLPNGLSEMHYITNFKCNYAMIKSWSTNKQNAIYKSDSHIELRIQSISRRIKLPHRHGDQRKGYQRRQLTFKDSSLCTA